MNLPKRFTDKFIVDGETGCWNWIACIAENGYGRFGQGRGRHIPAHRFSFERKNGPVPDGMEIDHKCRNKRCVNPDHLEAVTHAENMRRAVPHIAYQRKDHCHNGHPMAGDNLYIRSNGGRRCKACHRDRERLRYQQKKGSNNA